MNIGTCIRMKQGKVTIIAVFIICVVLILAIIVFSGVIGAQDKANQIICEDRCKEHNQTYEEHTNNMFKNNICYCDDNGKTEDYMI